MKTALTIAGSDCSGGAGIQADLKTMTAYGVYGMSVITALTAQNTLGVTQNNLINADVVSAQLMSVLSDITPNAIKIGMLGNGQIATVVAEILQDFFSPSTQSPSSLQAHENAIPNSSIPPHANTIPIVIDPVLVSTSGKTLLDEDGIRVLTEQLFPMATLITPNIPESEYLCNRIFNALPKPCAITNADDMIKAAQKHGGDKKKGSKKIRPPLWMCYFIKRRTCHRECRRSALRWNCSLVPRHPHKLHEHTRYRMYIILCHCKCPLSRQNTSRCGILSQRICPWRNVYRT
mgnify:CR=1 FL=1